jgi:hypothetical protein
MTSFAFPSGRLPATLVRIPAAAARRPAAPVRTRGRHSAAESPGVVEVVATELDLVRTGRHAEPDWARDLFDPVRDDMDPLDWLGFEARQD